MRQRSDDGKTPLVRNGLKIWTRTQSETAPPWSALPWTPR